MITKTLRTPSQTLRQLPRQPVRSVTILGLGNIGSALAELLGRMHRLKRITLVDHDHYDSGNIRAQNILPCDVGKPKVQVQARKLRQIAPDLQVQSFHARLEDLTLRQLRSDLLVSCLDSRIARMHASECAFRLGVPLLDGAVDGSNLQGRVAVYLPGSEAPCLECQFSDEDYAAIEQVAACTGAAQVTATNAPAALGAIVAGMQSLEIQKMVEGHWNEVLIDRQVFIDFRHHKHFAIRLCRNPSCRFDHQTWNIEQLPADTKPRCLGDLFELGQKDAGSLRLGVRGQHFVRRLICTTCRKMESVLMLSRRFKASKHPCGECGSPMMTSGFDTTDWLAEATLNPQDRRRRLKALGLRQGDVLTFRQGDLDRHVEFEETEHPSQGRDVVHQVQLIVSTDTD